jgi:hypothetical protein
MVRPYRNNPAIDSVELGSNLIGSQFRVIGLLFWEWFVLVLGKECCFVLKLEIHRMLDGR